MIIKEIQFSAQQCEMFFYQHFINLNQLLKGNKP
jgi:hypothetical protein